MSEKLFESDFLTVDLQSMFNNASSAVQKNTGGTTPKTKTNPTAKAEPANQQANSNINWGEELKNRLAANRQLGAEARKSEYDIETKFFYEYFNANWDAASAKELMIMGEPLRKDMKILGFNKKTNPILAFLSLSYVQKELLQTKLLNINTYRAIHNAYAKRYLADSELYKANDYNVIYCKDLYKRTLKEMEEYLKLQSEGPIKPKSSVYTLEDQTNNKKIFLKVAKNTAADIDDRVKDQLALNIKFPSMKSSNAVLNSYDFADAIKTAVNLKSGKSDSHGTIRTHKKSMGSEALGAFASKFMDDPAKTLAFLQYISITTGNERATKALSLEALKKVSMEDLRKATVQIAEFMPKTDLSLTDAKNVVDILIGHLT